MKLVPFDKDVREQLAKHGYTHIEIRDIIPDDYLNSGNKQIQMFKALDRIDTMPASAKIVPIRSKTIDNFLSNPDLNCYIAVHTSDKI